jgi:hypothetical protein
MAYSTDVILSSRVASDGFKSKAFILSWSSPSALVAIFTLLFRYLNCSIYVTLSFAVVDEPYSSGAHRRRAAGGTGQPVVKNNTATAVKVVVTKQLKPRFAVELDGLNCFECLVSCWSRVLLHWLI